MVEFNNECFKGEGPQNVAIPCDSSQECFYVRRNSTYSILILIHSLSTIQLLFNSRLHIISWLLAMQCVVVLFEMVVLLRVVHWYQTLSISVFLLFNYFILHRLLYNRLIHGKILKKLQ